MNRDETLNALDLNNELAFRDHVHSIAAVQAHTLVDNGESDLALESYSALPELEAKALLVRRFQKTWTELAMDINRQTDYPLAERTAVS